MRYREGAWEPVVQPFEGNRLRNPVSGTTLASLSVLPSGEGWSCGLVDVLTAFKPPCLRLQGGTWEVQQDALVPDLSTEAEGSHGSYEVRSLELVSPVDGWAVGNYMSGPDRRLTSLVLRFDGERWRSVPHPQVSGSLLDVDMLSTLSTEGWAVGSGGAILHYKDGKWEKYER
jgi:hypothetical protein